MYNKTKKNKFSLTINSSQNRRMLLQKSEYLEYCSFDFDLLFDFDFDLFPYPSFNCKLLEIYSHIFVHSNLSFNCKLLKAYSCIFNFDFSLDLDLFKRCLTSCIKYFSTTSLKGSL